MNERALAELDGRVTGFRGDKGTSVGVRFRCPTCPDERRHNVIATWSGPSLYTSGAVWKLESAPELAVLTLSPSIDCDTGENARCRFHGWVRGGKVQWQIP